MLNKTHLFLLIFFFTLSGCATRTYSVVKDRVDQDLGAGNRGYLHGKAPADENAQRKTTRETKVLEIELPNFMRLKRPAKKSAVIKPEAIDSKEAVAEAQPEKSSSEVFEKYTVQKGDTLQKIYQKLYGSTKKWQKIFEANKDILSAPNKIYPGQIINVPAVPKMEPAENLK
jgi:nucleoid-associated protein YgaU